MVIMAIDNETENRIYEGIKKSMRGDLAAGQRDLIERMNKPEFVSQRSWGTFKVLTEAEIAERRGSY